MIISASRRTDIPAFFAREFMESIRAGFRIVRNPYSGRETRLSLAPADVECIVFWSKNPEPLLPFLPELEERGYRFYFQFTLTPYGTDIERNLPPKRRILQTFRTLSEQIGAEKVIWRYDPVIFSAEWTAERHSEIFRRMTDALAPYTKQCIISFMDFYGKCLRRPECRAFRKPSEAEMLDLSAEFFAMAQSHGLRISACAEALDLTSAGIEPAHCIDPDLIETLTGRIIKRIKDRSQRPECGCAVSRDIGAYATCRHNCVYCYAN